MCDRLRRFTMVTTAGMLTLLAGLTGCPQPGEVDELMNSVGAIRSAVSAAAEYASEVEAGMQEASSTSESWEHDAQNPHERPHDESEAGSDTWPHDGDASGETDDSTGSAGSIVVNAGPDGIIESGEGIALAGQVSGAAVSYVWSPSTGLDDPRSLTPVASPTQTTVYTLTATDSNGATAVDQVTITVLPALLALAGADVITPAGVPVQLNGTARGGDGFYSYEWSPATGLDDPTSPAPIATVNQTTTYTLTVMDGPGRVSTDQVTVTVP